MLWNRGSTTSSDPENLLRTTSSREQINEDLRNKRDINSSERTAMFCWVVGGKVAPFFIFPFIISLSGIYVFPYTCYMLSLGSQSSNNNKNTEKN